MFMRSRSIMHSCCCDDVTNDENQKLEAEAGGAGEEAGEEGRSWRRSDDGETQMQPRTKIILQPQIKENRPQM